METIIVILIVILIMSPIALSIRAKTKKAEEEYKRNVIKYKETKDLNAENNFYIENIAKDINSINTTLKFFLIMYILPTIIQIIIILEVINKIDDISKIF